jgi:hypothetical protein
MKGVFPLAEDGGFGPMHEEVTGGSSSDADVNLHMSGESEVECGQGEDFDDFEAGAGDDDFGDFDDGFQQQSFSAESSSDIHKYTSTQQVVFPSPSPFVSESIAAVKARTHRLTGPLMFETLNRS